MGPKQRYLWFGVVAVVIAIVLAGQVFLVRSSLSASLKPSYHTAIERDIVARLSSINTEQRPQIGGQILAQSPLVRAKGPKESSPAPKHQAITVFTNIHEFNDINVFALTSWVALGVEVIVCASSVTLDNTTWEGEILATLQDKVMLVHMSTPFPTLTEIWETALAKARAETRWFAYVDPTVVLPPSFTSLTHLDFAAPETVLLMGGKFSCIVPRLRSVGPRAFKRFDLLYFHEVLNCEREFESGHIGYAMFHEDFFAKKQINLPPFWMGASDRIWTAWMQHEYRAHMVDTTALVPSVSLRRRPLSPELSQNEKELLTASINLACGKDMNISQSLLSTTTSAMMQLTCLNTNTKASNLLCKSPHGRMFLRTASSKSQEFIGEFIASAENLTYTNPEHVTRFYQHFTNALCSRGYTAEELADAVTVHKSNPHKQRWAKREDLHVCLANCWWGGLGSRTVGLAIVYNLSLELGLHFHMQEGGTDYEFRNYSIVDHFGPIYDGGRDLFYPKRCDYVTAAFDNKCIGAASGKLRSFHHFPLYDEMMYGFFRDHYSKRLRQVADDIVRDLYAKYSGCAFIPVYIRMQDRLGKRSDIRKRRPLNFTDYIELMDYSRAQLPDKTARVMFLMLGDQGINYFRNRTDVVFLEELALTYLPREPTMERAGQFVGMDVMSRFKRRVGIMYTSNVYMQLAFHKLNNNTEDVEFADVFSKRVYTYDFRILKDFHDPRFAAKTWGRMDESPYRPSADTNYYHALRECFEHQLFAHNSTEIPKKMRNMMPCERNMLQLDVE